ncbi:MAG: DUF1275 domain-containing protein [Solobacterium sp.]|nr:DUF1275 domain-containing protein [Solobacterium sp.]
MTVKKKAAETIYFSVLMIFIGGMMDGYSYVVRGGVFANGQTGNFIKLGLGVVNLDKTLFIKSIVPIIGFWLGIFAAEHLFHVILKEPDREIRDVRWKRYILWAETVLLLIVGLIPGTTINLVPNSLISFTAALQYCCFRKLDDKATYSSVFASGNMRSCAENYYMGLVLKRPENLKRAKQYTMILLGFLFGAVFAAILARYIGEKTIWITCAFLLAASAVVNDRN